MAVQITYEAVQNGSELRGTIRAMDGSAQVGLLEFTEIPNPDTGERTTTVRWIEVDPAHQRQGIALRMIGRIRDELPDTVPQAVWTVNDEAAALRDVALPQYGARRGA